MLGTDLFSSTESRQVKPLLLLSGCLALGVAGAAYAFGPSLPFIGGPAHAEAHSSPKAVALAHKTFIVQPPSPEAAREARAAEAEREKERAILLAAVEVREAARIRREAIENATAESVAHKRLPAYRSFQVDEPYIALTFDDGPNPSTTPRLLDILKERGVRATFFVLGSRAAQHPELLRRIAEEGHEIANHSWNHPQLPKLTVAAAEKQITDTDDAIFNATGQHAVYMRPPYGAMRGPLQEHLNKTLGISFIYWTIDPLDWKNRDPKLVHQRIVEQATPGAIVLAHDIHPTTVDAMPQVLDDLAAKGYRFGTLSQMVEMDKASNGKMATARAAKSAAAPAPVAQAPRAVARHQPVERAPQPAATQRPASDLSPRTVTTTSIRPTPYAANRSANSALY